MNTKKLLKGNFFRTFVWSFAKFFITFAPSNKKNDKTKTGTFPWWPLTPK